MLKSTGRKLNRLFGRARPGAEMTANLINTKSNRQSCTVAIDRQAFRHCRTVLRLTLAGGRVVSKTAMGSAMSLEIRATENLCRKNVSLRAMLRKLNWKRQINCGWQKICGLNGYLAARIGRVTPGRLLLRRHRTGGVPRKFF